MRPATLALLLGLAEMNVAAFLLGGPEWGAAALLVTGFLTLLVGVAGATGGLDGGS